MTAERSVYRRVLRRETHSPRTGPAVVVASVAILVLTAVLVLGAWMLIDAGFEDSMLGRSMDAVPAVRAAAVPAGIVLVLVALVLAFLAVAPGRRRRRGLAAARMALLVDDGVLADAATDRATSACGLRPAQLRVTARRRTLHVHVTPTSGVPVDPSAIGVAAAAAAGDVGLDIAARVVVADRGVLS